MTLTRETIHDIVLSLNCGDGYDAYERANQATDEIWDLVEPTVREDGKMLKSALYSPPDVAGVPASQPPLTLATFAPSGLPSRNEIASEVHAMLVHRFAYDEACLHGEFIGGPTDGEEYRMCEFVADLVTSLAYPEPAKPSREGVRKAIAAGIGAHAWAGSNLAGMECDCGWEGCEHDDHLAEAVADAVLALFAAQPTVREAKAEAWDAGWVSATVAEQREAMAERSRDHWKARAKAAEAAIERVRGVAGRAKASVFQSAVEVGEWIEDALDTQPEGS